MASSPTTLSAPGWIKVRYCRASKRTTCSYTMTYAWHLSWSYYRHDGYASAPILAIPGPHWDLTAGPSDMGSRLVDDPDARDAAHVHAVGPGSARVANPHLPSDRVTRMNLFPCPFCQSAAVKSTGGGRHFLHYRCTSCQEVWTAQSPAPGHSYARAALQPATEPDALLGPLNSRTTRKVLLH